ncbi:MAG TPA: DUF2207 domain-containing protein [Longimicrobium sp.]|jgi:uncharacterized membrane protein YgcG|nr:DUF2207 domain-containing protein [Longimicrobium sp.]
MRRAFVLLFSLAAALAAPAALHARDIVIRDYQSDVVVNRDGTTDVTETLRVYFEGSWNGIFRDLSLQHMTGQGRKTRLDVHVLGVADADGRPLQYWEEHPESGVLRIKIAVPGASDAERTVAIRYRVRNAVRFFFAGDPGGMHDELYWNATGNAWDFPIEHARARITVPDGALPTQQHAYTGYAGSTANDATVSVNGQTVAAEVTRTLARGEGLTLAVAWPAGVLARPTEAGLRTRLLFSFWPLLLAPLVLFLMGRHWWRHGRDPREQAIVVAYQPPEGMTPAEVGTLVDNSADLRDITSTLVDLAVRGFVGIEEVEDKHLFGLISSKDWAFHRRTESTEGLLPHERSFMDALFSGASYGPAWGVVKEMRERAAAARAAGQEVGEEAFAADQAPAQQPSVRLSSLKNEFYKSLPGIRTAIFERLVERGYYLKRPDTVKGAWMAGGIVLAILSGVAAGMLGDSGLTWINPLALGIGGVASGIIVAIFGALMAARTEQGARAREAALGFREFLDKVDSDRYRRMITSPELFEKYLPYAMAFGVEGRWAKAFEDIYREPPGWYAGSGYHAFSATYFSSSMSSMSTTAGSTMSSSPSGSSGGGSSGGGSGGGGGGGW